MVRAETNASFGELFAPGSGVAPEWQAVAALRIPYQPGSLPSGVVLVIAAVDVQADRLIYIVRGWGARATSWLIENGDLWGDRPA